MLLIKINVDDSWGEDKELEYKISHDEDAEIDFEKLSKAIHSWIRRGGFKIVKNTLRIYIQNYGKDLDDDTDTIELNSLLQV